MAGRGGVGRIHGRGGSGIALIQSPEKQPSGKGFYAHIKASTEK